MSNFVVMGARVERGAGRSGCSLGPAALRDAGLIEALEALGHTVVDRGDLSHGSVRPLYHPNPAIKALAEVSAWTAAIDRAVYEASADASPIILGGDHSIAAGTLPALNRRAAEQGRKLFVLWLDAHPDFHTLDTTRSGNLHGVPLAYVAGQPGFEGYFPPLEWPIAPERICLMGLRSIDNAEWKAVLSAGLTVHEMSEMRARGTLTLLGAFLDRIEAEDGLLHVSLDADFIEPAFAPGVGTAVSGGPSGHEASLLMQMLADSGRVRSLDIAELNPTLDRDGQTARLLVDLTATLMGHASFHPSARNLEHA